MEGLCVEPADLTPASVRIDHLRRLGEPASRLVRNNLRAAGHSPIKIPSIRSRRGHPSENETCRPVICSPVANRETGAGLESLKAEGSPLRDFRESGKVFRLTIN